MCGKRHASFPEEDFLEIPRGFVPRNPYAEERRKKAFDSNQIQLCGDSDCENAALSSSCFA